jgi:hypothetical protein
MVDIMLQLRELYLLTTIEEVETIMQFLALRIKLEALLELLDETSIFIMNSISHFSMCKLDY